MRPKSLILLGLALGCGLVAAVGINQILATPSTDVQTVGIVVAKSEIKKGDVIKPGDIRLQEWHVDALPEGAIQNIGDLAERRVKNLIVPGEAILEMKLIPKGREGGNDIPPGMKGVSVQVDSVSGGAGLILPGDNVDVLVHLIANMSQGIPATTTKVLLKNIKVHAVDSELVRPDAGESAISAKTVTLTVTPKQASTVALATQIGKIQLVLRSAKDAEGDADVDQSVSLRDILGDSSLADATPSGGGLAASTLAPEPPSLGAGMGKGILDMIKEMRDLGPVEPVGQPWKMVLIEGIERKEMEFSKDSKVPQLTGSGKVPSDGAANSSAGSSADDVISKLPPIDQEEGS